MMLPFQKYIGYFAPNGIDQQKYSSFVMDWGVSLVVGAIPGGIVGAELSSLVTDKESIVSISSTVTNYLGQSAAFFPLYVRTNRDIYYKQPDDKLDWKKINKDGVKILAGAGIFEVIIYTVRPLLVYYFQKRGLDPAVASLVADLIIMPPYSLAAGHAAAKLKVIRNHENDRQLTLELIVEKEKPNDSGSGTPAV